MAEFPDETFSKPASRQARSQAPACLCSPSARQPTDLGHAGQIRRKGHAARIRHRNHQRPRPARLGQEEFTRLVALRLRPRHPLLRNRPSPTATPAMLGVALKGIPRDSYRLMSKVTTDAGVDPRRSRRNAPKLATPITSTSCCCTGSTRPPGPRHRPLAGRRFSRPSADKTIPTHGASVHGLPALRQVPGNKWLDIAMIRMNHKGTRMDTETDDWDVPATSLKWSPMSAGPRRRHGRHQHEADRRRRVHHARTARRPCVSPSATPAWIASPSATRTPRRSTRPSRT